MASFYERPMLAFDVFEGQIKAFLAPDMMEVNNFIHFIPIKCQQVQMGLGECFTHREDHTTLRGQRLGLESRGELASS